MSARSLMPNSDSSSGTGAKQMRLRFRACHLKYRIQCLEFRKWRELTAEEWSTPDFTSGPKSCNWPAGAKEFRLSEMIQISSRADDVCKCQ